MKNYLLFFILFCQVGFAVGQNVGIGTTTPHSSAILEIASTSKGVLVPRLTTEQRIAIPSPAPGLLVFDYNTFSFWFFDGFLWVNLSSANLTLPYYDEGTSSLPTFSIRNYGSGVGIRATSASGPAFSGLNNGNGLAGVGLRIENTNAAGIGIWSVTNSSDANMVLANPGTGDLLRGFSGASAGSLVARILNNGTFITTGKVGIGSASVPVATLEVNGTVKIVDGTQGNGKVLTSDASGNASWKASPANPAASTYFQAEKTGNAETHQFYARLTNHDEIVTFPAEYADMGSNYNASTSTYTVPQSGYYFFTTRVTLDLHFDGHVWLELHAGSSARAFNHYNLSNANGNLKSVGLSHSGYFAAGTLVTIHVYLPPGDIAIRSDSDFSGWRVL